jgi:hypothetical protein
MQTNAADVLGEPRSTATNGKSMYVEGAASKAYKRYPTGLNREIINLVAEADTLECGVSIGIISSITRAGRWIEPAPTGTRVPTGKINLQKHLLAEMQANATLEPQGEEICPRCQKDFGVASLLLPYL